MTWKETTSPKTFTSQPDPPYLKIDLWQKGSDLYKCIKARTAAQGFNEDDWVPATPAEQASGKADAADQKAGEAKEDAATAKAQAAAAQSAAIEAQTFYAASNTAAATAAKATASEVEGFVLKTGVCVRVKFTYANTKASPSLNFSSTGAKAMRLNGAAYAYWQAGATIDFVYDGTYWQVANVPLYGATSTIGNPAAGNVYTDADGISIRKGTTVFARWTASLLELGKDIATATIDLLNGLLKFAAHNENGQKFAQMTSNDNINIASSTGGVSITGLRSNGYLTEHGVGISKSGASANPDALDFVVVAELIDLFATKTKLNGRDIGDTGWLNLWVTSDGNMNIKYRRMFGWVMVSGECYNQKSLGTNWTNITTLPEGFRPSMVVHAAGSRLSATNTAMINFRVSTAGIVAGLSPGAAAHYWAFSLAFPV